jgi:hypothetical protein
MHLESYPNPTPAVSLPPLRKITLRRLSVELAQKEGPVFSSISGTCTYVCNTISTCDGTACTCGSIYTGNTICC